MIEHDISKLSDDELASEVAKANATMEELKASARTIPPGCARGSRRQTSCSPTGRS